MRFKTLLCLALFVLIGSTAAYARTTWISQIQGTYKERFVNFHASGQKYWAENILDLDKIDNDTLYMHVRLDFYDARVCEVTGWAKPSSPSTITFHETTGSCKMEIAVRDGMISTIDNDGCEKFCGDRGSFQTMQFNLLNRRKIRYLDNLRASAQYQDVLAAWRNAGQQSQ